MGEAREVQRFGPMSEIEELGDGLFRLHLGPQHPISGQGRFLVVTDGERVYDIEMDIGYSHRGIEKILEHKTFVQGIVPVERMVMLDTSHILMGYVGAIEKVIGIEPPPRANYIRTIVLEINRIISHLYALGLLSESAAWNPAIFLWTTADREPFLDLLEMLTGARWSYSFFVPGGVRADLPNGFKDRLLATLDWFEGRIQVIEEAWIYNELFRIRTEGLGVVRRSEAIEWGLAGPNLRVSGVPYDTRKNEPYAAYKDLDFRIVTHTAGDAYARGWARVEEMKVSVDILRQAIENIPDGPIRTRMPPRHPPGEALFRVETSRGEMNVYIVTEGKEKPYRLKISAASFRNFFAIEMIPKTQRVLLADVPVIIYSFDPWFLDADR
jgi:NADH-quinone oxidoreductase subunit D